MELNCLIDSELLSLNQSFDDAYIEMLFLLESEQKVKLFVTNYLRLISDVWYFNRTLCFVSKAAEAEPVMRYSYLNRTLQVQWSFSGCIFRFNKSFA